MQIILKKLVAPHICELMYVLIVAFIFIEIKQLVDTVF